MVVMMVSCQDYDDMPGGGDGADGGDGGDAGGFGGGFEGGFDGADMEGRLSGPPEDAPIDDFSAAASQHRPILARMMPKHR